MNEKTKAAVSYVLGWITGLIMLVIEKDNKYVRFHAMQSVVVSGIMSILIAIVRLVPFLGGLVGWALGVVTTLTMVYLIIQALAGKEFKVPVVGEVAWNQIHKA